MKSIRGCLATLFLIAAVSFAFNLLRPKSPFETPPPEGSRGQRVVETPQQREFVLIKVNSIQVRKIPPDLLDGDHAQMEFFIFVSDGKAVEGSFDPFRGQYRDVRAGSEISLGTTGAYFTTQQASDRVLVWFLAVDTDELDFPVEFSLDQAKDFALDRFKGWAETASPSSLLAKFGPWTSVAGAVADAGLGIWKVEDLIGQALISVNRSEGWDADHYVMQSEDDAISINYEIILTHEMPLEIAYADSPTQPSPQTDECPGVPPPHFKVGETAVVDFNQPDGGVRIRSIPGPSGARLAMAYDNNRLKILDGPVCAARPEGDKVWWWRVYFKARTRDSKLIDVWGWVPEGVANDRWLCPLSQAECGS
jgi:hypothetical protein